MRWFRSRRSRDADLADELRSHLDMSAADHERRGASKSDAAAAARREFGNLGLVAEVTREMWSRSWLERLSHDVRFAARGVRRRPAFAVVAILSLALGIGATGAVYGVVDTLLFRRLPVADPDELMSLSVRYPGEASARRNFSFDAFKRIREVAAPAHLAAECIVDRARILVDGSTTSVDARVSLVSGHYFSVVRAAPRIGRAIEADDDAGRGAGQVTVISDALWRDAFHRRFDVIGRAIVLGGTRYSVIGVMPADFVGDWPARPVAMWVPIAMQSSAMPEEPGLLDTPFNEWVRVVGRVPRSAATAPIAAAAQQAFAGWADDMFSPSMLAFVSKARVTIESMERGYAPERAALARPLIVFLCIVVLVLLVACSNVANLLLAHAALREREISLRVALGASRLRLVRQAMTEAGLLAGVASSVGLVLAYWGSERLRTFIANGTLNLARDVAPSWSAIVAATLACLAVCFGFSVVSSLRLTAVSNVGQLVGRQAASTESRRWKLIGRVLVVAQLALSLSLLMMSGLFVRTLRNLRTQQLGFARDHVALLWASPGQAGLNGPALTRAYSALRARLASLPGVQSVGVSHGNVGGSGFLTGVVFDAAVSLIDDRPAFLPHARVAWLVATPRFFDAMGMRIERGRDFRESDDTGAPPVAIITQSTARRLFPGRDPIGRRFGFKRDLTFEVIGVVQDARFSSPRENALLAFLSYRQDINARGRHGDMLVAIHATGPTSLVAANARSVIAEVMPQVPIARVGSISAELDRALSQERLLASLASVFGVLTIFIACSGIYGTIAYRISRSMRELGIRMALGATPARVVRLVMGESAWLTALGTAIGLALGLTATRAVASLLYGVSVGDTAVTAGAAALVIGASTLAAFVPTGRAMRSGALDALRQV